MAVTPMMQQYLAAKREHPDGILFFRMGDFYEMFLEDAEQGAALLGIALTSRSKGEGAIPMAGVPVRTVDTYVKRLIRLGKKVVICDQMQDPAEAKGIVERAITRVVTPGTILEEEGLDEKEDNWLCAVSLQDGKAGLAYADISTAAFRVEEVDAAAVLDEVRRIDPAEVLVPESARDAGSPYGALVKRLGKPWSTVPDWRFDRDEAGRRLCEHFGVARLDGFGVAGLGPAIAAAGAVLHYLQETQRGAVSHLTGLRRTARENHLVLDGGTRASLELVRAGRDGERKGSLLWVLDRTLTPMGARALRRWILEPLIDVDAIRVRQDGVAELAAEERCREALRAEMKRVQDVERLLARVACGRASARELVGIRESLAVLPAVRRELDQAYSGVLRDAAEALPDLDPLVDLLRRALLDEVPPTVKEGGLIRPGYDPELDEIRDLGAKSRDWIAAFQVREQGRSGIPSLKVAYNKVFGYYIEVTHVHSERIPSDYIRKQTVKNAERYITPELKEYEDKVLGAEERVQEREYEHFLRLRAAVAERLRDIQAASDVLALLDGLLSLAEVAKERRWVRPEVDSSRDLEIAEGRHPVLDQWKDDGPFVPNDLRLRGGERELILLTGPNMAGKSTYIRQAALLVVMAQAGSFVPAASARIGVVDRIFTRIGASDELTRGNSTFMVEMIETAAILNGATDRSLVVLDEVGRGTSTYDGLAIAWAITEHLAGKVRCRTLFATHYHHLLDLAASLPNAVNMNVAVREWGDQIVFLHKIVEGGTDRSYGIHVARLAGVPREVLARAEKVLSEFESEPVRAAAPLSGAPRAEAQLSLFPDPEDPIRAVLREIDLEQTKPLDALLHLKRLQDLL